MTLQEGSSVSTTYNFSGHAHYNECQVLLYAQSTPKLVDSRLLGPQRLSQLVCVIIWSYKVQ